MNRNRVISIHRRRDTASWLTVDKLAICADADSTKEVEYRKPRFRFECQGSDEPCPFISCRYHLYSDVKPNGSLLINHPDKQLDEMVECCALNVANKGGATLAEIGSYLNISREAVRKIIVDAFAKILLQKYDREFDAFFRYIIEKENRHNEPDPLGLSG